MTARDEHIRSTPLAWAVESQDPQIVQQLLSKGADPNGTGNSSAAALILACQYGDPRILNLLIR